MKTEDVIVQGIFDNMALVLFIERPMVKPNSDMKRRATLQWQWMPVSYLSQYRVRTWTRVS